MRSQRRGNLESLGLGINIKRIKNQMSKDNKILFIIEKEVISGNAYFGSSNDLLLIVEALKKGIEVYVITPEEFFISQNNKINFEISAYKLEEIDLKKVEKLYEECLYREVINALTALPASPDLELKKSSKILFSNSKNIKINLKEVAIFNRTEPVSLDDRFYDCLINLKNSGVFITPNPELTKILGDKKSVYSIHHNAEVEGINLARDLAKEDIAQGKNKISFDSLVIKISNEKLTAPEVLEFYRKIEASLEKGVTEVIFSTQKFQEEFKIFSDGAKKYVKFHEELNKDSVAKPASYFGGCGVVPAKEIEVDILKAMKNICKVFEGIREDCEKGGYENRAVLPSIIIQKRATHAHLGDLRIVICAGELQGIIVRVNPSFEKSAANNMHHGGHPETLFGKYSIDKKGAHEMIFDMKKSGLSEESEEIKKVGALYGLLETIEIIKKIEPLKRYAIIGADALLTKQIDGSYRYGINELNLTSPMGQTQILAIKIGVKNSDFAMNILIEKNYLKVGQIKEYQVLSDYCKTLSDDKAKELRNILLENQELEVRIKKDIAEMIIKNNPATKTIEALCQKSKR